MCTNSIPKRPVEIPHISGNFFCIIRFCPDRSRYCMYLYLSPLLLYLYIFFWLRVIDAAERYDPFNWQIGDAVRATLDGEQRVDDKPISLPSCNRPYDVNASSEKKQKDRTRIVVISHDSAMETFFHSPEQGARDASAILDIGFEWNRHLINSGQKMTTDIRNAVDSVSSSYRK